MNGERVPRRSFWAIPWSYRQGVLFAAAFFVGAAVLDMFPHRLFILGGAASGVFVIVVLLLVIVPFVLFKDTAALRYLSGKHNAIIAISFFTACVIIMGLIPQTSEHLLSAGGVLWVFRMKYSIVFFTMALYLLVSLGYAIASRCRAFTVRNAVFLASHGGLFLVILGMCAGSGMQQVSMTVHTKDYVWYGRDQFGNDTELPLAIKLESFTIDYHSTNVGAAPRQFRSVVSIVTSDKKRTRAAIAVNAPFTIHGVTLYQSGYDAAKGALSDISIIHAVRDPWIGVVYAGMIMLLIGAVCMVVIYMRSFTLARGKP